MGEASRFPDLPRHMAHLPRDHRGYGEAMHTAKRNHPLYHLWKAMVARCHKPSAIGFANYGGRGISVCPRWREDFWTFVDDLPPRPSREYTLDRIDNDGGYEPSNVRWATRSEQRRNSRQSPDVVPGIKLSDASAQTGLARSTIKNRLYRGWSPEDAIASPAAKRAENGSVFPPGGHRICAELGLNARTVQSRLRRGWTFERAIAEPVDSKRARKRGPKA